MVALTSTSGVSHDAERLCFQTLSLETALALLQSPSYRPSRFRPADRGVSSGVIPRKMEMGDRRVGSEVRSPRCSFEDLSLVPTLGGS